jgi:hypothetical protein
VETKDNNQQNKDVMKKSERQYSREWKFVDLHRRIRSTAIDDEKEVNQVAAGIENQCCFVTFCWPAF